MLLQQLPLLQRQQCQALWLDKDHDLDKGKIMVVGTVRKDMVPHRASSKKIRIQPCRGIINPSSANTIQPTMPPSAATPVSSKYSPSRSSSNHFQRSNLCISSNSSSSNSNSNSHQLQSLSQ